jgi:tRNA-splicing ligase RtcB
MKKKELINLGLHSKELRAGALQVVNSLEQTGTSKIEIRSKLQKIVADPSLYADSEPEARLARLLIPTVRDSLNSKLRIDYCSWGRDIDEQTHDQMKLACSLPVACGAALMPDAHLGYGLPIGGVLATENSVIPYAVGVDIGCRVKVSLIDVDPKKLRQNPTKFENAIEEHTSFGIGARFKKPKDHPILDADWSMHGRFENFKDLAWGQLGTSGSGNHFVEFGEFILSSDLRGVPAGRYLAFVSHSGSRGPGSKVASYYTRLAQELHPSLPAKLKHLAWLDLDTQEGQEYWDAMSLMGDYASANHEIIHKDVIRAIGGRVLLSVENHHNFAWKEMWNGKPVIVHRKGATPAEKDVLGFIPGTMVHPGFLVKGLGNSASINSCSHGAGRAMSRKKARNTTTRNALKNTLKQHDVRLLSCGLDESPHAYKAIAEVMQAQKDLVSILGTFQPKIVKMAPEGEKAED